MNQIVLIGRLTRDVTVNKTKNDKDIGTLGIAVPRSFKNADGVYETDFIDVTAYDGIVTNTSLYCKKGDLIGVKGRLESQQYEDKDGEKRNRIIPVAEKVTFLSSKAKEEPEPER